jgi:hypothetical protein
MINYVVQELYLDSIMKNLREMYAGEGAWFGQGCAAGKNACSRLSSLAVL